MKNDDEKEEMLLKDDAEEEKEETPTPAVNVVHCETPSSSWGALLLANPK